MIPHFGAFQRQVNALFAPFGISVEFGLSRQKRLQMTWIFPPDPAPASTASLPDKIGAPLLCMAFYLMRKLTPLQMSYLHLQARAR